MEVTVKEYEVLESKSSNHAVTETYSADTFGQQQRIESQTYFVSEQEMWVRDVKTGAEVALDFRNINLKVRPTHRLLIAYRGQRMERIHNVNTNSWYDLVQLGDQDKTVSDSSMHIWAGAMLLCACFPFLGLFVPVMCLMFPLFDKRFRYPRVLALAALTVVPNILFLAAMSGAIAIVLALFVANAVVYWRVFTGAFRTHNQKISNRLGTAHEAIELVLRSRRPVAP